MGVITHELKETMSMNCTGCSLVKSTVKLAVAE